MLDNIFWLLELVRDQILKKFIIPDLNISYWEFCIYGALVAVVVTVLVNAVPVSAGYAMSDRKQRKLELQNQQRENIRNSYAMYKQNRERNEAYDDLYRFEHGQKLKKR